MYICNDNKEAMNLKEIKNGDIWEGLEGRGT